MTIYVLGTRGFPDVQGGIERHCERLYPRLAQRGFRITVFTRIPYIEQRKQKNRWHGVRFIPVWCPRNKYLEAFIHTFLCVIRARLHSPDFLHFHAIGPALLTPFARLLGLQVIFTHHGPDYKRKKWGCCAKFFLKLGEWMGVRWARHVIVVSRGVKQSLVRRFKRNDIHFNPNGVDVVDRVPDATLLDRFGLRPQRYLLAVGRFVPEKGLDDLCIAYDRLSPDEHKLVIVGDADHVTGYSRQLKALADKNPGVILTGVLTHGQLRCLYHYARLFVLPSYYEGLPITLLEALSYGCQVIASDIPATREILLGAETYFPAGNITALQKRIQDALNKPLPPSQRAKYKNIVKNRYNWDRIADQTIAVLQST